MDEHFEPLTDAEFEQLKNDMADKFQLITELMQELDEMKAHHNAELERRQNHPGADIHQFRPRPSNGPNPTDQGSR